MLKLAHLPGKKLLRSVCSKCGRTISEGIFFLVLVQDGTPTGLIPEGRQECCGEVSSGPKFYSTQQNAETGAHMLASNTLHFDLVSVDSVSV